MKKKKDLKDKWTQNIILIGVCNFMEIYKGEMKMKSKLFEKLLKEVRGL